MAEETQYYGFYSESSVEDTGSYVVYSREDGTEVNVTLVCRSPEGDPKYTRPDMIAVGPVKSFLRKVTTDAELDAFFTPIGPGTSPAEGLRRATIGLAATRMAMAGMPLGRAIREASRAPGRN